MWTPLPESTLTPKTFAAGRDADVAAVGAPPGGDAGDERAVPVDVVERAGLPGQGDLHDAAREVGAGAHPAVDHGDARAGTLEAGRPRRRRAARAGEEGDERGEG